MKINRRYSLLIIFLTFLNIVSTQRSGKCGIERFQCQNGDCIASELLCDGKPNCKDQSDETEAECSKPGIVCSEYAFRCSYGACVDGDVTCNGVRDCIDNSDETLPRCSDSSKNITNIIECSVNQFKCDNGQCIDNTGLCDGIIDCQDQSDETFLKCGSFNCPQYVFRCNYGACIDGDLKCNGIKNCADGSDEDPKLCEEIKTITTSSTFTPSITPPTITTTSLSPWTPAKSTPCLVPSQPENGRWKLHKSQCQTDEHCDVEQGVHLYPGAYLVYTCNHGYKVKGSSDVFCGQNGVWLNIPICVEIRCKPLTSASTDATCTYRGEWTSCESPVLPKTVAKMSCRNSYRQDTTFISNQWDSVTCNERGLWEPEPIRCVPVCGVISPPQKPLIVNGTSANISDFPWHATLYEVKRPGGPKEFTCGATIIQDNLLVTAAHCVFDEANKKIYNPKRYYVATGNIFRDYDSPLHEQHIVKKAKVKNIYVSCSYLGLEGNYAWDIALLEIDEPFVFSSLLLPICLDTNTFSDQTVLEVGNYGKVAGFGRTAFGPSSFILQTISVPYVPLNQCKSSSTTSQSEKFITIDKFCAGYTNGSSVCDGDSGGGLVFKTGGLWYLRGIVSVGLGQTISGGTRSCDSHSYSLYTRVSNHLSWIQDIIFRLETSKSLPPCNSVNFHKMI
ncbi:hypothetical protein KPH14_001599 [Odynerus spinipes]|uniref:Limulus clotting factor C n=1 Tax=Odynerus spinipes TaxID=1348599 RepID=A0AAD9VVU0_9HYME|nr:hypothetical protein KPH14_001599 [Odynerus spinipes]